jgi:SAM-dependent methyltransferase
MFEFHKDRRRYFDMQIENTVEYLIPFVEEKFPVKAGMRILEIGCGEGGVLKAFIDCGCYGVGVELDESRLVNAREWLREDIEAGRIRFVSKDIYKTDVDIDLDGSFDVILLKDVIEHIHDQPKLIAWMKTYLRPNGTIFFGFPPWQMPFGGHQQLCRSKILSKLPYYHLLPRPVYKWILQKAGEPWQDLVEIKDTGISIERFERIVRQCGYSILHQRHYLINPIYKYKFGWKAKEQFGFVTALPFVRDYLTTCVYYLIQAKP